MIHVKVQTPRSQISAHQRGAVSFFVLKLFQVLNPGLIDEMQTNLTSGNELRFRQKLFLIAPLFCWNFTVIIHSRDLVFRKIVIDGTAGVQSVTEDHHLAPFG